ncbi:AAA family ATPase [Paraburkholderia sp. UCT2]|uniref:AAA family ATPase n=1 Tax=Paraburkholderia sp. UCT2 TaxID=2615208 RepID=UPI001656519F|nr:AAA family ATPase [Paraburkholderia sp. UCT2]
MGLGTRRRSSKAGKDPGKKLFDSALLKAPARDRVDFLKESIISHAAFDNAIEEAEDRISSGLKGTMIVLVGPTGFGKSVIVDRLHTTITTEFFESHPEDLHTVPSILVEAWSAERKPFDFRDFYEQLLVALQVPLISDSLPEVVRIIAGRELTLPDVSVNSQPTMYTLRRRLRSAIDERNPIVMVIDEASNILKSRKTETIKDKGDTLRSMINRSYSKLFLTGAYDLYELVLQSGQLARRGELIHVRNYLPDEIEQFSQALISLQNCMPCEIEGGNLDRHGDLLAKESLRGVGNLKRILVRSLSISCKEARPIDEEILRRSFFKPKQLEVMRNDAFNGYWWVEGHKHPEDDRPLDARQSRHRSVDVVEPEPESAPASKAPKRRPGVAKPVRRTIGDNHDQAN